MLDKTYRPQEVEADIYAAWERSGAFACDPDSDARPFTIMMPPPNVTGSLHMGHALNHTLQDLLVRYWRRRGRDALWQPGMDHAGIATQMVVERQLAEQGKTRHDLGREGFIERVWQWKAESGGMILGQLRRLGTSPDWARERFTMDEGLNHAVRHVFVQLFRQGLIYRDKRLVNWDPQLHTAISDLEVESKEVKGHLWHLRYPLEDDPTQTITVATTRPETMLGDTGIAVHPEDDRYRHLVGRHAVLPLVGRRLPIVADEYADPEQGSGAVKMTPAHDFNDFEVGRRHGLALINVLDRDARINDNAPEAYRGLDRFAARERVVADLEAQGLVAAVEDHAHAVPHGDRSGVVIEPWLTDQWYCDAAVLARPAIEAVEQGRTVFVPKNWENTYFEWMRNIQPWCISRQLWWGHRIPAWYGPDGHIFVEETEEAAIAAARAHYGDDPCFRGEPLTRDPDVLDTWFSSALWPFSTLGWPDDKSMTARYYPSDVLITGFDIIFFWVARMMMMGLHFMDDVPFHTVYIHALVRDAKGQKMSKSKGNIIDPLALMDRYGADALRFTLVAMAAQGRDIKLSENRVEGYRNFATKLWNAARYCQMNECRPQPGFGPRSATHTVNRWIVGAVAQMAERVDRGIEAYRFNDAATALYQFTWGTFCDWYLEFTKPILTGEDEQAKAETRATTAWALDQILHRLNPIMPFLSEALWQEMGDGRNDLLIDAPWPDYAPDLADPAAMAEMDWVVRLISAVRAIRAEMNVPAAAEIPLLIKDGGPAAAERLDTHGALIRRLARLSEVTLGEGEPPRGSAQAVLDEATLVLPLADIVDLDKERTRLTGEIGKLDSEIAKIDAKLANQSFLAKAPEEVVEEQRERRAEADATRTRLKQAVARLAGA
ncbi:MAG: valine--tRNA ligase [Alphaproteobacteria bacterium]|jgi:valyl-tRNA synthetase|nr:valine--tRNA ligase [Alphaproteobacteria bacterium]